MNKTSCSTHEKERKKQNKTLTMLMIKLVSLWKMPLEEVRTPRASAFFITGTVLCRCQREVSGLSACLNKRVCANPEGRKPTCTGGSAHNEFKARRTNVKT